MWRDKKLGMDKWIIHLILFVVLSKLYEWSMLYWYKRELMAILKRERQIGQNLKIFNKVISLNLLFSLSFYANFE